MKYLVLSLSVFAIVSAVVCAGCADSAKKQTAEEIRMEYFGRVTAESAGVNDYMVVDDGQMVVFSSAPLKGNTTMQDEREYLKEFMKVMAAVSRWKREHADTKVSIAVCERGGNAEYSVDNAYYTVRVVLLRE